MSQSHILAKGVAYGERAKWQEGKGARNAIRFALSAMPKSSELAPLAC